MQTVKIETNLPPQKNLFLAYFLNNPEMQFEFSFVAVGSNFILAKERKYFLIIRSSEIAIRSNLPVNHLAKSLAETIGSLELPCRVFISGYSFELEAWLIATSGEWLCLQSETGRFWISNTAFRVLRWPAGDN